MKTSDQKNSIPELILGVKLTDKTIQQLASGKETELIKSFKHRNGESFDAYLTLSESGKLLFRLAAGQKIKGTDEKENIKVTVSIAEIATEFGFKPQFSTSNSDNNVFDYLLMTNRQNQRIIVHKDANTLEHQFFSLENTNIEGNIFDFLDYFSNSNPAQNKKIIDKYFLSKSPSIYNFIPTEHNLEVAFFAVYSLEPLQSKEILLENGIRETTLDHSFFRGRILNHDSEVYFPTYVQRNINGFSKIQFQEPIVDPSKNSVRGKNSTSVGSIFGIWHSNIINKEKVKRLIILSSPLEALFYHQLYSKPSDFFTVYASLIEENLEGQIQEIQNLIDYCEPEHIIIANKDSLHGLILTNVLLGGLNEPRKHHEKDNSIREISSEIQFQVESIVERDHQFNRLWVNLSYNEIEKGILMNENLYQYFLQINNKEVKDHPELEGKMPFIFEKRLITKHKSQTPIVFPNKKEYLDLVAGIIQHLRPLLFMKVEKPEFGSFQGIMKHQHEEKLIYKELKSRKLG